MIVGHGKKTIALVGTFDTKGDEYGFVAECIRARGHRVLLIDVGILGASRIRPDVSREQAAAEAGVDLAALALAGDRGAAVEAMSDAARVVLSRLVAEGRIDGLMAMGGGGGTAIATAGMRVLPIGFPKVMVSTLAAGNIAPYIGVKDVVMISSVVDIAGVNRISRPILARAAGAVCGMVETDVPTGPDKPVIAASMFGNTTDCVQRARAALEQRGFEVLVFHATGAGGRTMESLIESGLIEGVLDVTTTEWADELLGGVLTAGPHRLEAAARKGVPAVVGPGCMDMVNFQEPASVPARYAGRRFYHHNPQVTLMRTSPEECSQLGKILAGKVNASTGPVSVVIPLAGISVIGAPGQPFHDADADAALFAAIRNHLNPEIRLIELDCTINDPRYAEACAGELLNLMRRV